MGINAELVVVDWPTVLELREDPDAHEMSVTAWGYAEIPVSYAFLNPEWSGWTDDEAIQTAVDEITFARDEDTALEGADALQEAFYDYLPIITFGDRTNVTGVREGVAGYEPPPGVSDMFYRVYPTE